MSIDPILRDLGDDFADQLSKSTFTFARECEEAGIPDHEATRAAISIVLDGACSMLAKLTDMPPAAIAEIVTNTINRKRLADADA
jgi:hypothetical protein